MARLDKARQEEKEPGRVEHAKQKIEALGYEVSVVAGNTLKFEFKENTVVLWPYSGWHTGKSIKDGRGLKKLINQIR